MTAIALKLRTAYNTRIAKPAVRRIGRRGFTWELAGVLTLMGSSVAYASFALAHLG